MKKIFLFLLMIVSVSGFSQLVQVQNSFGIGFKRTGADTLLWMPSDTLKPPADVITKTHFARKGNTVYYWDGVKWVAISSGGITANNGTSLSGTTIQLGGAITGVTLLPVSSNPIQIIHSAIDTTTATDSMGIILRNTAAAPLTSSAYVSPRLIFATSGRKTSGGAAAVPVQFMIDAYGKLGNPNGGATLRIRSSLNGVVKTLYTIDDQGRFGQNLKVSDTHFGVGAGSGGIAIGVGNPLQVQTTSAARNNAIGGSALSALTDGVDNLAIGDNVGANITTGSFNTAIGSLALVSGNTSYNTAVGFSALKATTGDQNTAIGTNAMVALTTGQKNNGVGAGAFEETTTGNNNTGVGHDIMLHNVGGSNNAAFGYLSLATITAGNGNSAFGYNAGTTMTTGDSAIFIGATAGTHVSQALNAGNSIAIGYNSFTTGPNQIKIGNTAHNNLTLYGPTHNVPSAGKMLVIDTITNRVYHQAIPAGGSTPTLQQVLTAGSSVTGAAQSITGTGSNTLTFTSFDEFNVSNMTGNSHFSGGGIYNFDSRLQVNDTLQLGHISGFHSANDSMLVWNPTRKTVGYRPIPSDGGLTVGTSTITSGTNTRILYDNSGVLGEYTLTGTGTVVAMQTSPTLITSAKVQYDGSNHLVITPASTGDIGFVATGSAPSFTFNKGLSITGTYGSLNDGGQLFWDASGIFYVDSRSGGSPRQIILQGAQMDFKSSGSSTMTLSGANVTIAGLAGTGSRNVVADASGVLSAPVSDRSVKTNIRSINYGLNTIMNLKPVSFEYREGWKNYGSGIRVGFIAQDIEKVLPNSVFTTELTGKMGYNETDLIPVLVKAVQELTARVEALENENKKLRRK